MNIHKMLRPVALLATLALLVATFGNVFAITDGGVPDSGDTHPEVVLILMEVDGVVRYRCSGTLMSEFYVLTAGHCTGAPGEFSGMRVLTGWDIQNNGPTLDVRAARFASHPDYPNAPFFFNDVGMIELESPIFLPEEQYGELAEVGSLDTLATRRGRQNTQFTAVGYGLQRVNPVFIERDLTRHVAHPNLIQINTPGFTGDFSMLLSNNASTGGTCFGDSGGPNYTYGTKIVAGITSFGINGNCAGTGGVFRTDKQNVHDFVDGFMGS